MLKIHTSEPNSNAGKPLSVLSAETANDQVSSYCMDWPRRIYARPATPGAFSYSRRQIGERIPQIMRDLGVKPPADAAGPALS